jgi:uncharacterized membrane protein
MTTEANAKRPTTALAGPYGHPFHPMLVALPIGAWIASLVFDVASHFTSPRELATGALWLIALGVLGAVAAAMAGFLDFFGIPTGTPAHRTALLHMCINLTVTVAFALDFWWRTAIPRTAVPVGPIVLSLVALAALGVSGYLGGKLAYTYGVRVADEESQRKAFIPRPTTSMPARAGRRSTCPR